VSWLHTVCEHPGWYTASGGNKVDACLKLLQRSDKLLPRGHAGDEPSDFFYRASAL